MSCKRCGGFKVLDYLDGPYPCSGYRCINCGAITDIEVAMTKQSRKVIHPRATKNSPSRRKGNYGCSLPRVRRPVANVFDLVD